MEVSCSKSPEHFSGLPGIKPRLIEEIYAKYWKGLVRLAITFTGCHETGKEIVQQVLVNFYAGDMAIRKETAVFSYLCRAVRNRALNFLRDRDIQSRHSRALQVIHSTRCAYGASPLEHKELKLRVRRCLDRLPERFGETFILYWEEELTVRELASLLGRPESTVEKQLHKARRCLREHFGTDILQR